MDIPATVLNKLKCSQCDVYLSRGPVYLQHDGAASCGRCFAPDIPATRNSQYEEVARLLKFPCKNQELGCMVTVPYTEETQEIAHEEVCEFRQYVCPVLGSAECDWLGTRAEILHHCSTEHPERVVNNPATFTHDITKPSARNFILLALEFMFLLHTKVCVTSGKIYHSVRFLGESHLVPEFKYTLDIKRGDFAISRPGDVAPQGCLAIQEPTSVALSTNSLLDVLGGFTGTTFTVTVTRREEQQPETVTRREEQQPETSVERPPSRAVSCEKCNIEVTVFQYRNRKGWRCEQCAPPKNIVCMNYLNGCSHTDFRHKSWKHERLFCSKRNRCYICKKYIADGSIFAHYTQAHASVNSGSTWRVSRLNEDEEAYCLVSSVAGIVVCRCEVVNSEFKLNVFTPVLTEQLYKFHCKIKLIDPVTRREETYTPRTIYSSWWDWCIQVQTSKFPSWSREFIICVDITRGELED